MFDEQLLASDIIAEILQEQDIPNLTDETDTFAAFVEGSKYYDQLLRYVDTEVLSSTVKQIQCTSSTGGYPFNKGSKRTCLCAPFPCHNQHQMRCLGCLTTATTPSAMKTAHTNKQGCSEQSCVMAYKDAYKKWASSRGHKMEPLLDGRVPKQEFFSFPKALCSKCGGPMSSTAYACWTCGRERMWQCPTKGCPNVVTVSLGSMCCSACLQKTQDAQPPSKKPRHS